MIWDDIVRWIEVRWIDGFRIELRDLTSSMEKPQWFDDDSTLLVSYCHLCTGCQLDCTMPSAPSSCHRCVDRRKCLRRVARREVLLRMLSTC
ncbi:hypothetical protein GCK72_013257 [Caenorhabditis remanei]|uniref:Uncharacterized protein n=1 Tax=Caenorhabditis remanei TaxID=31234 RepID=A0A6A5GQC8_CAERE|nr:hypothetical protein GCK72_013257 [Caenorhabditis remanei]KAF1756803.1 hypothetical protein GCK72_013257 [Caenorhabditis remanei]